MRVVFDGYIFALACGLNRGGFTFSIALGARRLTRAFVDGFKYADILAREAGK